MRSKSNKREFLQLCHTYDPKKHHIAGWFVSEKLDGMRAYWDGGITRGLPVDQVPWANTEKDGRYVIKPVATGLWTRYGKAIQAPVRFLESLPKFPLDGELYMGRGKFQDVMRTCKDLVPGPDWDKVKYVVFDAPSYKAMFQDGEIKNSNFKKHMKGAFEWVRCRLRQNELTVPKNFESTYRFLNKMIVGDYNIELLPQYRLPFTSNEATERLECILDMICREGGEGVVLRNPVFSWEPLRSYYSLKYKPWHDAEATVVGYTSGRETELGSKLLGMMGALIVDWKGKRFKVSGFTDQERKFSSGSDYAQNHPDEDVTPHVTNDNFPLQTVITFKYRELTEDGIPKEARYYRKHQE